MRFLDIGQCQAFPPVVAMSMTIAVVSPLKHPAARTKCSSVVIAAVTAIATSDVYHSSPLEAHVTSQEVTMKPTSRYTQGDI